MWLLMNHELNEPYMYDKIVYLAHSLQNSIANTFSEWRLSFTGGGLVALVGFLSFLNYWAPGLPRACLFVFCIVLVRHSIIQSFC